MGHFRAVKGNAVDRYLNLLARMCDLTKSRGWTVRRTVWSIYGSDVISFIKEVEEDSA